MLLLGATERDVWLLDWAEVMYARQGRVYDGVLQVLSCTEQYTRATSPTVWRTVEPRCTHRQEEETRLIASTPGYWHFKMRTATWHTDCCRSINYHKAQSLRYAHCGTVWDMLVHHKVISSAYYLLYCCHGNLLELWRHNCVILLARWRPWSTQKDLCDLYWQVVSFTFLELFDFTHGTFLYQSHLRGALAHVFDKSGHCSQAGD